MSNAKTGIENLYYIEGQGADYPEYVSFEIERPDASTISGGIIADLCMGGLLRKTLDARTGTVCDLNDAQISELFSFIRHNRDRIKYERSEKSYEEWRALGIPLEDYMPIWTQVDDIWLEHFDWLDSPANKSDSLKQWLLPYSAPVDRPALDQKAYHTFSLCNGKWEYCGICPEGYSHNLVFEISFYGKLEFPGPGAMAGETVYYRYYPDLKRVLRDSEMIGRPVNPVYLTRREYFNELQNGMGRESDAKAVGPLSDVELAEEAQRVVYRTFDMRPDDRQTRYKGFHQVFFSDDFLKRSSSEQIMDLMRELPFQREQCFPIPVDGPEKEKYYLFIPYEEKDACVGVGLAGHQKRFRDENGVLTVPLSEIEKLTREEADAYYIHDEQYINKGMLFTYYRYWTNTPDGEKVESGRFIHGEYNIFVDPASLGTFLPNVSSAGREIVAVKDKRFQPMACLTKSLKKYVAGILEKEAD